MEIDNLNESAIELQLPSWRPGRYELGNFSKNIVSVNMFTEENKPLKFEKTTKDAWIVKPGKAQKVVVEYTYYADVLNAGSTYLDEHQLYVNPVNCFMYCKGREGEEHQVLLDVPKTYELATALRIKKRNILIASSFDELADAPFIASDQLKHHAFKFKTTDFHLWFMGECKPDFKKIEKDFLSFIKVQYKMMKDFPFESYHFMFQILPTFFYHGVEHLNSTVIALGPSYDLMEKKTYDEFMGVSSHELFHAWNIKTIRPIEMMPYDFTKESYTNLGYVAEGVTTYYGDLFLLRSGYFSVEDYLQQLGKAVERYVHNYGVNNMSVAQASFDTWLDGYVKGVPNRKVSIYNEGSLIAFMVDVLIRKHTDNKKSLDDVMYELYKRFGKKQIGFSEQDYKHLIEKLCGVSFFDFFDKYVWGTNSYLPQLKKCLSYLGIELNWDVPELKHHALGFKISSTLEVTDLIPDSLAEESGMTHKDVILAVNTFKINKSEELDKWLQYFEGEIVSFSVLRDNKVLDLRELRVSFTGDGRYLSARLKSKPTDLKSANHNFISWSTAK